MANTNILKVSGIDFWRGAPPPQMQLQEQSKPFTQGLQYVDKALQRVDQSIQVQQQSLAARTDNIQRSLESQGRAVSAGADAAVRIANASAGAKTGGMVEAVAGILEAIQKQQQMSRKAQQQANRVVAQQELEDLKLKWTGKIYDDGVGPYRTELLQTLSKYDLDPEDLVSLTKQGYSLASDYVTDTTKKQQQTYQAIRDKTREVRVAQARLELNSDLSKLAENPYADATPVMQSVDKKIAAIMSDKELPELDRMTILVSSLEAVLAATDKHNTAYEQIQQRLTAAKAYVAEEAKINEAVATGKESPMRAQWRKQEARLRLGVHPSWNDVDFDVNERTLRETMTTRQSIEEMRQRNIISAAEATSMNDKQVAYLAWSLINTPGLLEQIEADPEFKKAPGAVRAIALAKTYKENGGKVATLLTQRASLVQDLAESQKRDVIWFVNQAKDGRADESVRTLIERLALGPIADKMQRGETLTKEEKDKVDAASAQVQEAIANRIKLIDSQVTQARSELSYYGLTGTPEEINTRVQGYRAEYETWTEQLKKNKLEGSRLPTINGGMQPPFDPGVGRKVSFGTMDYNGKQVRVPFESTATFYPISGDYAEQRGNRQHAGVDIPAPEGTNIVSLSNGRVERIEVDPNGYGYYVDILGDDGKLYRYAHAQTDSSPLQVGSHVAAGQLIARVGNTGSSTGAHLHLEVRDPDNPFGFNGTIDPLGYMASQPDVRNETLGKPRTDPTAGQEVGIPPGAFPLGHGRFIHNGKLYNVSNFTARVHGTYNSTSPVRSSYAKATKEGFKGKNNPNSNYGYARIKREPELSKAIAWGADQLGIPAQWLADLIALETNGSFDRNIDNGAGFIGYIQAGESARTDLGVGYHEFSQMTPMEQMRRVVVPYVKMHIKWADSSLKGMEWLVAAVWGGHTLVRDLDARGAASINDPKNNDSGVVDGYGGVTFREYLDMVGSHAGRKYDHAGNRAQRVSQVIHKAPRPGCQTCAAFRASGSFVPHEGSV